MGAPPSRGPTPSAAGLDYRRDIDGLRAIAVLIVVLNHAGFRLASGGFVGVDVFFVISGYLITRIIQAGADASSFSFGAFYFRRAKRLLPALYAMMLATLVGGYWILTPGDFSLLGQSALSAVGLFSNHFFWHNTGGYFSSDASAFPLLHVWSLSVEEQFYLVWPVAFLALLRVKSPAVRLGLVGLLALVSLACAQYGVSKAWAGAYFLAPARAFEFLLGALVHLLWRERAAPNPLVANLFSGLGLLGVLASVLLFSERSGFPGVNALLPCVAAALIIAAPQFGPSLGSRLLGLGPMVAVGLASYSIYLWHWPMVSYLKLSGVALTPPVKVGLVVAAVVAGFVSWRLIERFFRARLERKDKVAWGVMLAVTFVLVGGAGYVWAKKGLPERFPYALLTQDQLMAERGRYWRELPATNTVFDASPGSKLLIVGNSHAYDLAYAIGENGDPGKIKLIETNHQCFNFGHDAVVPEDTAMCAERLQAVLTSEDVKVAGAIYLHDNWGRLDLAGLDDMIARLRALTPVPIYVFGPKMSFSDDVLNIAKAAQAQPHATIASINQFAAAYRVEDKAAMDVALKAHFASKPMQGVAYVSILDAQCGGGAVCQIISNDGKYLFFDASHFTLEGSRRFGASLKRTHPELFAPP